MHSTMPRAAFVFVLLAALAPGGTLAAQEVAEALEGLRSLRPGNQIRLTSTEADVERGTYVAYRSGSLVVREDGDSLRVPVRELRSLHVRSRATWEGSWKMALIGSAVGAAWGVVVDGTDCPTPSTCTTEYWPRVPIDAAVGLGIGAVVGAGVGALITHWERVFP